MSQDVESLIASTLVDPRVDEPTRTVIRRALSRNDLSHQAFIDFCAQALVFARASARDTKMRFTMEWLAALTTAATPSKSAPASAQPTTTAVSPRGLSKAFFSPGDEPLEAIRAEFGHARRSADVCVFTITDDRISDAIAAAHRRGVKVRVITDNDKAYDEGSDASRLKSLGIPVKVDETEAHMHHKFAVFDDERLLTGSYNWTRSAGRYNAENVVLSDDPTLREAFTRQFETLWGQLPEMR